MKRTIQPLPSTIFERRKTNNYTQSLEVQWAEPVSLTFHSVLRKLFQNLPQVLCTKFRFIWLLGFRGEDFSEITRKKNCLWWPCLLTDLDEMRNPYRGPSIDVSYQVLVHLAKSFQRKRFFRNRLFRNKNCRW